VQFINFSTKVLRQGYLLYKYSSGTSEVDNELELLTDDVLKLRTKLEQPARLVSQWRNKGHGQTTMERVLLLVKVFLLPLWVYGLLP
jgi:hypothetical protein